MDDRIERLESKLMAAEDQIDALNRIVYRQQQKLDQLQGQLLELGQQVRRVQPGAVSRPEDEIPPHY